MPPPLIPTQEARAGPPYRRIMTTTWTPVEPRRAVDVLFDDHRWHRGLLRGWRRGTAGWKAFVDVTPQPGYTYLRWVTVDQVRPH